MVVVTARNLWNLRKGEEESAKSRLVFRQTKNTKFGFSDGHYKMWKVPDTDLRTMLSKILLRT